MGVDHTQPLAVQDPSLDETHHLVMAGNADPWQLRQEAEHPPTVPEASEGQLTHDHRVVAHIGGVQRLDERRIRTMQVVDPDRRVGQDHRSARSRRSGGAGVSPAKQGEASRTLALYQRL